MVDAHFGGTCSAVVLGGFVVSHARVSEWRKADALPLLRLRIGTTFFSTDPWKSRSAADLEALGSASSAPRLAYVCDTSVLEFG